MSKPIIVTGAAGFIGSAYVRHVLDTTDRDVLGLDVLTYAGDRDNLGGVLGDDRLTFVEGDVTDPDVVGEVVADAGEIVHLAAHTHVDRAIDSARPFAVSNVVGTQTLLEAARKSGVERFVYVSTDEVYGETPNGLTYDEAARLWPRNPYAAVKAAAGLLCQSYLETHGVPVVRVRPTNTYGPRQHEEKFIPRAMRRLLDGGDIPLYGTGAQIREWTFVDDTCRAIDTVRRCGEVGSIYNAGSGERYTNLEVARAICEAVGVERDRIEHVPDRPGHDRRYALDSSRLRGLGWDPEWSLTPGLVQTAAYERKRAAAAERDTDAEVQA